MTNQDNDKTNQCQLTSNEAPHFSTHGLRIAEEPGDIAGDTVRHVFVKPVAIYAIFQLTKARRGKL